MEVMFDRVAGLDVGKESVTVCVRTPGPRGGRRSETRTFKTMFGSLRVMRDWLVEAGVTIAAMESTSTYWKPPFYCLEEVMVVWLLNAAHMKAVPGRKSDVRDAEWIAQGCATRPTCWVRSRRRRRCGGRWTRRPRPRLAGSEKARAKVRRHVWSSAAGAAGLEGRRHRPRARWSCWTSTPPW